MVIKVYANDGTEFKGDDYTTLVTKLKAYEANQKPRKQRKKLNVRLEKRSRRS